MRAGGFPGNPGGLIVSILTGLIELLVASRSFVERSSLVDWTARCVLSDGLFIAS